MANSPFRVTDSWTGEQMEFKNYDAYIAYMDKKESSASKTAKKIIEQSNTADSKSKTNAAVSVSPSGKATADTPGTFSEKDTETAAKGSGKSTEQAAKEFADKETYSPTGIWEFDLGYAAGRARKKKIEAAGGKEAFKAAKQEKKIARQKRKKDAGAFDKQSARTTDKAKQRKKAAKLPGLMDKNKEVKGLPKNSNPLFKPMGEMQKITPGPLSKVNSSLKQSSISRRDNGASKSKGKTKNTMGKMQKITSGPLSKNKPSLKQSSISSKKAKLGADMKKEGNFYKKMLNSPDFKTGRTIYTDQKSITAARKRGEIY